MPNLHWYSLETLLQQLAIILLILLLIPIGAILATRYAFERERTRETHDWQLVVLCATAYALELLALAALALPLPAGPNQIAIRITLVCFTAVVVSPGLAFMVVVAVFGGMPAEALPFWSRWMLALSVLIAAIWLLVVLYMSFVA